MISRVLRALGKSRGRVVVVFARSRESADAQVLYLRSNLDLPVWVFAKESPSPEVEAQCGRVVLSDSALVLWWRAQRELWPHQVALAMADWDASAGAWLLKLAPFTIPFFRPVFRNRDGGIFAGSPRMVGLHASLVMRRKFRNAVVRTGEVVTGAALWVFAFFAQGYSPLSRFAYRRIQGSKALSIEAAASGEGIAVHRYSRRTWNAGAILDLLRTTSARYVFFQRDDDVSDPAELLEGFCDPLAFVVSRQFAVREWRDLLFATAPFRTLQQGEISRVQAPVSAAMLVDVAKLRSLNLPALSSYGSNWYLLFHQAAAAGWNSYSLGGVAAARDLDAVPFDEAEFVKTLLAERELRDLDTGMQNLARGNIARSVVQAAGFRGLPRVLVVSPYLPFPLSHGGAVRIWNLCRALSARVDFVLVCFREQKEHVEYAKLREVFRDVYVVDIDEKHRDASLPQQVNGYESSTMRALIYNLVTTQQFDVVQIEYTQMAGYLEAARGTPAVLVEHDLTFTLYRQLGDQEYQLWLRFERERLRAFPAVWTMSERDRARAVAEGSPETQTYAIPNGVDLERFRCAPMDPLSQNILLVGSFRHRPNYLAFDELRTRIMPAVWNRFPGATLSVVAGPRHTEHWLGARELDSRITVYGFVEDLLPLYAAAAVVVVPLPVSAGTNIKLMEALACERPIVTTAVGCAGLELADGRDVLIRELGDAFPQGICELLGDAGWRQTLAANGLKQARERFGWDSIAEAAYASYEAINPQWGKQQVYAPHSVH